ncbi:hypothetical protein [Nonomuraea sp. NPDC049758]|uniref:hypothetical protein n=1 Tax=Nonomuraea sp. NPDC049758 TaxID=3154360 RepID=UPI0034311EFB
MRKIIAVAAAVVAVAGGLAVGSAAHADEWEGPIDAWTRWPIERAYAICDSTGRIGVQNGVYRTYKCEEDGFFTVYLYVHRR